MKTKQHFMKSLFFGLLLAMGISQTTSAQATVVEKYGRLQVNGSHVTAENGDQISLAGVSLFWSIAGDVANYYTKESVDHMVDDWGISIIRIAMGVNETWDGGNGYVDGANGRQTQLTKIEPVIEAAINRGIYVIVDWHSHEAEKYTTEAKEFFGYIANKYGKDNKNIIYEIYNEPLGDYGPEARTTLWNNNIKPYAETVIEEIRKIDAKNLVVVGTPFFSQGVDIAAQNRVNDNNVAYALHFYAGSLFNGGPNWDHTQGGRDTALKAMDNDKGIAIFVTEWGTVEASGAGNFDKAESEKWLEFMKTNGISHVNWALSDKAVNDKGIPEASSIIQGGQGVNGLLTGKLTESGNFVRGVIKELAFTPSLDVQDFILNGQQVQVYPNPVTDILNIKASTSSISNVKVLDLQGRLVLSKDFNALSSASLDLSPLTSGVYVLQLNNLTATQISVQ